MKVLKSVLPTLLAFLASIGSLDSWIFCLATFLIFFGIENEGPFLLFTLVGIGIAYEFHFYWILFALVFVMTKFMKRPEIDDILYVIAVSTPFLPRVIFVSSAFIIESAILYKYARDALSDRKNANELIGHYGIFKVRNAAKIMFVVGITILLACIFL